MFREALGWAARFHCCAEAFRVVGRIDRAGQPRSRREHGRTQQVVKASVHGQSAGVQLV